MAITAKVLIDGEIYSGSYMASIAGVREQLTWQGQFDEIQVTLNSFGGDIAEGLGMYDLLRSYEKPITTIVIGQCCSAATIVFLAGKSRLIYENVVAFMVHQAKGGGYGTADEVHTIADFIDSYNERMTAIYMEKTGADAETVAAWIDQDTFMTAEEALTNGFATSIAKPVTAKYVASIPITPTGQSTPITATTVPAVSPVPALSTGLNPVRPDPAGRIVIALQSSDNTNSFSTQTMKIIKDKATRMWASVKAIMDGSPIVAKKVTTDAGDELTIETADGGDNYAEGDAVMKGDEAAPDGTYVIGNVTMVVKDGKIESLTAAESADTTTASGDTTINATGEAQTGDETELATVKAELVTLKAENADLKKTQGTISAKMNILLASHESKDISIPAPKGQTRQVSARATGQSEEETEREKMLEERKNRGLGKTAE